MKRTFNNLALVLALLVPALGSHGQICSPAINQLANPQMTSATTNTNMTMGQTVQIPFRFSNTGNPDVIPANTLEIIITVPDDTKMAFQPPYIAAGSGCGIWTVDMTNSASDAIVLHNTGGTTPAASFCDIQLLVKAVVFNVQETYSAAVNRINPSCAGDADASATDNTKAGFLRATVPLPVHFSSFTASQKGCTAILNWTTDMEYNNDYFAVERSNDGKMFSEIGRVHTAGNSNDKQQYTYNDRNPATGANQYRITQVDLDRKSTSTAQQTLNFDCGHANIKVYPSVTNGTLYVDLPVGFDNAEMKLYTLLGQVINLQGTGKANHSGLHTLQLSGLAQGSYLLRVANGSDVQTFKVIYQ